MIGTNILTPYSSVLELQCRNQQSLHPVFLMHGREARFPLEAEKLSVTNLKMENVQTI